MNATPRKIISTLVLLTALAFGCLVVGSGGAATAALSPADDGMAGPAGMATEATAPHGIGQTDAGAEYARGEVVVTLAGESDPRTLEIPPTSDPERVADLLEEGPAVRSASPNFIAHVSGWRPNDPGVSPGLQGRAGGWMDRQWNFLPCGNFCHPRTAATSPRSRGGMNVLRAWQHLRQAGRPGASGVKIAVLDTGIAYRNLKPGFRRDPDLSPRRFLPGYDFVRKNRLPLDRNGHGTHIASTIAQTTNNRLGMTGVAYRARIIPVRVMDSGGHGSTANIIAGIRWAANHGARVITMSLNFGCGVKIPALESAINYAYRKGTVLVGSSGNRSAQDCPSLPATSPRVISVGGTTEASCVGTYSFRSDKVDLAAPGGGSGYTDCPYMARNRSIMQVGMIAGIPDWFGIESGWVGTSMAAAHVAGAAAAVIASRSLPGKRGPAQVIRRLTATARLPAWAKGDPASGYGAGIVDLGRAVNPAVKTD